MTDELKFRLISAGLRLFPWLAVCMLLALLITRKPEKDIQFVYRPDSTGAIHDTTPIKDTTYDGGAAPYTKDTTDNKDTAMTVRVEVPVTPQPEKQNVRIASTLKGQPYFDLVTVNMPVNGGKAGWEFIPSDISTALADGRKKIVDGRYQTPTHTPFIEYGASGTVFWGEIRASTDLFIRLPRTKFEPEIGYHADTKGFREIYTKTTLKRGLF